MSMSYSLRERAFAASVARALLISRRLVGKERPRLLADALDRVETPVNVALYSRRVRVAKYDSWA